MTGPQDSPYQGTLRPHPHRRAPVHDHRHACGAVRSPYSKAKADRGFGKNPPLPSSSTQTLGQRKDPCFLSRESAICTPGHSRGQVLSARVARRGQVRKVLVRDRAGNSATQTRSERTHGGRTSRTARTAPLSGNQSRMHIYIATRAATGGEPF